MAAGEEFERETAHYHLIYRASNRDDRQELLMRRRDAGKHFARHTRFNLLDDTGRIIGSEPITPAVARFIMQHFEYRGDTASFDVYRSDLAQGQLVLGASKQRVDPADIRHQLTNAETAYTATGAKLRAHWPIFRKYGETGYGSIIRATMTLHQVCSSHCHFCSTIARNRKDAITLDEAKRFVEKLYFDQAELNRSQFPEYNDAYKAITGADIRLRGLILSGGGQPNLWPHFAEFVEWLSGLDIDLGLITNGFPTKVPEDVYGRFKWVRISVTPDDASPHYPDGRFDRQYLPAPLIRSKAITTGYSYVYGPWTTDDVLGRLDAATRENGFSYCRLLTDCNLTRSAQLRAHQALAERLHDLGMIDAEGNPTGRIFHQLKYHGTSGEAEELWGERQCFLQTYNVFWDTTGHEEHGHSYCYPCDSITVLAEEPTDAAVAASERRFNHEKWGTVPNDRVEELYRSPIRAFFDPRKNCTACLFMRNNRAVKDLIADAMSGDLAVPDNIDHVNFP